MPNKETTRVIVIWVVVVTPTLKKRPLRQKNIESQHGLRIRPTSRDN